jgi:CRISPR-associated protein Cmr5
MEAEARSDSRWALLEQRRAISAWECVERVLKWPEGKKKGEYRTRALALTSMVLANGLGQVAAFLYQAKEEGRHADSQLYDDLSKWVVAQVDGGEGDLLEAILNRWGAYQYMRATDEAIAFLSWLKRFAAAKLPKAQG